jgi:hypothetical protein
MPAVFKLLFSTSMRYYLLFIITFIISSLSNFDLIFYFCPPLIMLCLGLHFYLLRKTEYNPINDLVYTAITIICITYLFYFPSIKSQFDPFGGWFFMLAHQFYFQVFKKEGTIIFESRKINFAFIIIPVLLCFIYIGLKLAQIPDSIYALSLIYTTHKCILFSMALYRPVNRQSYFFVVIGLVLSIISDIISSLYIFNLESSYNIYAILPYMIAQLFIINGILLGNKKVIENKRASFKLKRFVQTFFSI